MLTSTGLCVILCTEVKRKNKKKKEVTTMRIVHYCVVDVKAEKIVYRHCKREKSEEFIQNQENKENLKIYNKYLNI